MKFHKKKIIYKMPDEAMESKRIDEDLKVSGDIPLSEEISEAESALEESSLQPETGTVNGEPALEDVTAETEPESDPEVLDLNGSLDSFTVDDTGAKAPTTTKKFDIFRVGVLVVCAAVLTVSSYILIENIYEKYKSDRIYNDILDNITIGLPGETHPERDGVVSLLAADNQNSATPTMDEIIKNGTDSLVTSGQYAAELAKMRASLEYLKNINGDLYGYILVPGTNINYPIAQTDNNEYYLDHAYTGDGLVNGSIFADSRCNTDILANYNTILYGHNVTSGAMFNHVDRFFQKDVFDNTLIYLYTFDGIYIYKPFSIHETEYDSGFVATDFAIPDHFVAFAESLRDESDVKNDMEFDADSKMLTLSTCTNGIYTRRYALHAKLIEVITD